ncbi:MAG: dihydrofolate reductase [Azoarcus sp.]|jgi:dihydrofolate reductase|nr:dihydrofolate reductase [Azoarcus sp.]
MTPVVALIVAIVMPERVIGRDNRLPWKMPRDLRFFRKVTIGHTVIMGRKTFESLGSRPLPKRTNIVVTRNPYYEAKGCLVANSLEDAISKASSQKRVFIIGGGALYKSALEIATEAFITEIYDENPNLNLFEPFPGDTYFPELDSSWELKHPGRKKFVAADRVPVLNPKPIKGVDFCLIRGLYFRIKKFVRKNKPETS